MKTKNGRNGMQEPIYMTKDLNEISILLAHNFEYDYIDKSGECFFYFKNREKCDEIIESFWDRKLKMNIADFVDGTRKAKDLIFRSLRMRRQRYQ